MSFSRWSTGLEAVDLVADLPFTVRRGDVSALVALFHENSHVGDDHIRRTGRAAVRTAATGIRTLAALEPWDWARGYGGLSFLFDSAPSPKRWGFQTGLELTTRELGLTPDLPLWLYAGEDLQFHERVGFNPNSRVVAGIKAAWPGSHKSARLQFGYFSGHSYYGQFFADREHFADVSVILEL